MATYTMQLREYIEMFSQDQIKSTRDIIETGRTKLFDFPYPIFNTTYKKDFETHFIRKFYMREIGAETEGLFKFNLETWLLINMPYFNKLFESELIAYDPLTNTKIDATNNKTNDKTQNQTSTMDGTNNSTNTQDSNGTLTEDNFDRQLDSNNPDSRLSITANDGQGVIEYANSIQENNENNSKTSTTHQTGGVNDTTHVGSTANGGSTEVEDVTQHTAGKIGSESYAKLLNEHRGAFLRIENEIFNEMQELFMSVY